MYDPIHYLPLLEQKIGALYQAAPLQEWELPEEFGTLRLLSVSMLVATLKCANLVSISREKQSS